MRIRRARITVCPRCGMIGYGPYVEIIRDPQSQRVTPRVQVVHRIKVGKGYKTIRTCIV
jgi:hypothetical protein